MKYLRQTEKQDPARARLPYLTQNSGKKTLTTTVRLAFCRPPRLTDPNHFYPSIAVRIPIMLEPKSYQSLLHFKNPKPI